MKTLIFLIVIFFSGYSLNAQTVEKLRFNRDGEFKIVQFTDTHVNFKKNLTLQAYEIIRKVLDIERPDLVILTGDIVTQNNPQEAYYRFSEIFNSAKIPWAIVFGNHDSQHNLTRKELADFLEKLPMCLNQDDGKIKGNSNFVLQIYGKNDNTKALLYCMDSHSKSTLKPLVKGYAWFDFSQINWYREKSNRFTNKNNGNPLPALAFFHIPLPEYVNAWTNKISPPIGVRNEDECSPDINSGMFTAMLECGDIMGTFVGHDHLNDYIGSHYNIALAYGRVTKIMKNPEDPIAGGRVIILKEGKREFYTWIRDMNGNKIFDSFWPDSFKPGNQ
jgi:predicted phosphodiesterase